MPSPFRTIKKVLSAAVSTTIYTFDEWEKVAMLRSIIFCNSDTVIRKVWFLVRDSDDASPAMGAILFGLELDPNETIQMPDRVLNQGEFVIAYADVAAKVSFVADVEIITLSLPEE